VKRVDYLHEEEVVCIVVSVYILEAAGTLRDTNEEVVKRVDHLHEEDLVCIVVNVCTSEAASTLRDANKDVVHDCDHRNGGSVVRDRCQFGSCHHSMQFSQTSTRGCDFDSSDRRQLFSPQLFSWRLFFSRPSYLTGVHDSPLPAQKI
jgi:hypothetical protein